MDDFWKRQTQEEGINVHDQRSQEGTIAPPPKKLNSAKQIPMSALTIFSVAIVFHYNRYPLQNLSFYQIN